MRVIVLGGDGYLGWPASIYFSALNHDVMIVDNFFRRSWDDELGTNSLTPIVSLYERIKVWFQITGRTIFFKYGNITDYPFMTRVFRDFQPEVIIHFGEQRCAPYSMIDREHAVFTQTNNIIGTLNVLYCMKECASKSHLIKLGTMGEYGTPNIDIEEGFIEIEHNGRKDILPFPKNASSFYHLSKVHDSNNILFCCNTWSLRATDLNQGVVYGWETDEMALHEALITRFDYDGIWGTCLNRFCVEAVSGNPLTVYGRGGQTRGFLNIRDTLKCIRIAMENPAKEGEYKVFNQFTEQFSVLELAKHVQQAALRMGYNATSIEHIENPRFEKEEHYYNAKHDKFLQLGLKPLLLSDALIGHILETISKYKTRINPITIYPKVKWK